MQKSLFESRLVTADGTKVHTVDEFDKFIRIIPEMQKPGFEINMIKGLSYVELWRLYDDPRWINPERNQIILPRDTQKKVKQVLPKRTIDKLPSSFPYIWKLFLAGKRPPEHTSWARDLAR